MSPHATNQWQFSGTAETCESCRAPMVAPVPPRWVATFRGPLTGGVIVLHTPCCVALAEARRDATAYSVAHP